jgi:hypothetical protein
MKTIGNENYYEIEWRIYNDDLCTDPAPDGYYSDGTNCYSWFSSVLSFDTLCR